MSGPDLQVFTLKSLVLKNLVFPPLKNTFQIFLTFVYLYSMQLFSADPKIFSKKIKWSSKVAHNWLTLLFHSPAQTTAQSS